MNDQPVFDVISGMFGLISGMFALISGMLGLNMSSIEQGIRYSYYPLVVVFNILLWYRFHCRGMTKHLQFRHHVASLSKTICSIAFADIHGCNPTETAVMEATPYTIYCSANFIPVK